MGEWRGEEGVLTEVVGVYISEVGPMMGALFGGLRGVRLVGCSVDQVEEVEEQVDHQVPSLPPDQLLERYPTDFHLTYDPTNQPISDPTCHPNRQTPDKKPDLPQTLIQAAGANVLRKGKQEEDKIAVPETEKTKEQVDFPHSLEPQEGVGIFGAWDEPAARRAEGVARAGAGLLQVLLGGLGVLACLSCLAMATLSIRAGRNRSARKHTHCKFSSQI